MRANKKLLGRYCVVRDLLYPNTIVAAVRVREGVRLQSGEHFGELRRKSDYEFLEKLLPGEAPPELATLLSY